MRIGKFASLPLVAVAIVYASPAMAFGCGGRAVECYERVRLPDTYATRMRPVVVRPEASIVIERPAVMGVRSEKVEVAPARWDRVRTPAVYSEKTDRVLVTPARTTYVDAPEVRRTVRESVVVTPARVRWERSRGFLGRGERLCKVVVPAETRDVVREVVVSPARRVAQTTPAVYETRTRSVLVQPASVERVYRPAAYAWTHQPVLLRPAHSYVVHQPPVVGLQMEQVKVRDGGYGWRRSRDLW